MYFSSKSFHYRSHTRIPQGIGSDFTCIHSILLGAGLILSASIIWNNKAAVAQLPIAQNPGTVQINSEIEVLFVNPVTGDDANGNGKERSPFKTITQALRLAKDNTVILLAVGVYSSESGENFPLQMKPGVTIQGNPRTRGQNIIIRGGASYEGESAVSPNITILGANQAGLTGVTITNPNQQGYGLSIESSSPVILDNTFTGNANGGIYIQGHSAPTIRSNYFFDNGGNGIVVDGTLQPEVQENVFENRGSGVSVAYNLIPQLFGNPLTSNSNEKVIEVVSPPASPKNFSENLEAEESQTSNRFIPDSENLAEPENNAAFNNGKVELNNQHYESNIVEFGSQLHLKPEGSANLAKTENYHRQESNLEIDYQLPSEGEQPSTLLETQLESNPENLTYTVASLAEKETSTHSVSATSFPIPSMLSSPTNIQQQNRQVTDSVPVLNSNNPSINTSNSVTSTPQVQRYRVLVKANSQSQQKLVLSLIPDAFSTSINGQLIMQAGIFSTRDRANKIWQLLANNGLTATIEVLE
ncbi:MAG: DUF1565 domain-containing protein [Symploca sp. SIO2B6]|nr:DUF1565 domain-containing protein [Symploca sp. SIO2B6]